MNTEHKTLLKEFNALELNLNLLNNLTDSSQLVDNQYAYEAISLTLSMLNDDSTVNETLKTIFSLKSHEKFADIFEYLCNIRDQFDIKQLERSHLYPNLSICYAETSLNERRIFNLFNLDEIINRILQFSVEYRKYLSKLDSSNKSYLKIFLTCLNDSKFLNECLNISQPGLFVISLNWISKVADDYKHIWNSLNAVECLLKFTKTNDNHKITNYGTIANIAFDNDLEKITEINDLFIKLMCTVINQPDGRLKQQFKDEDIELEEFDVLYKLVTETHEISAITGILFCLYRLSINGKIKLNIFKTENFMPTLKILIINGIEVEKQYALQLLAQLAFNTEVNQEINKDLELIQYIKELNLKETFEYKKLQNTCKEILWILQNNQMKTIDNSRKGHIMISYNTATRDTCLKMKQDLENLYFKVWIDVIDINGSSLESMARAVENAEIVLICVTEKYRQSLNCQAEAQYAFKLNKPIIPCILQPAYQNVNGWLGILIGDKIFVDFTKYNFEESFRRLIKQIELLTHNVVQPIGVNDSSATQWSSDEVEDWSDIDLLNL